MEPRPRARCLRHWTMWRPRSGGNEIYHLRDPRVILGFNVINGQIELSEIRCTCHSGRCGMRVESVDTPSLRELRAMVAQRLQAYGAFEGCIAAWSARFWQDGWHPTQWGGCCDGVNGAILEVFVTETRQQALAACEQN